MQSPKDLLSYDYLPGRRLAHFVVNFKNTRGSLAICAQALSGYRINLLSGFHTIPAGSKMSVWSFFADLTESTIRPEEIAERLNSLPFVEGVEISESRDGLLVDDKHFPLRSGGRRMVMMRTKGVSEMLQRLWNDFGSGAAIIIDEMGEAMGRFRAEELMHDFGADFVAENVTQFMRTFTALGFAELRIESYDPEVGILSVSVKDLFECNETRGPKATRKSLFFKGMLRGFMSLTFNRPFQVVETECVTAGSRSCRFEISRLAAPIVRSEYETLGSQTVQA